MLKYKFDLLTNSIPLCSRLLPATVGFVAIFSTTVAVACPETNPNRVDYQNSSGQRRVLETSDGGQYACWWDRSAEPITFEDTTYRVVIRCSENLILYTHLDGAEEVVINSNGTRNVYQAEFLGDRYECDAQGQTMIKPWIYRQGAEVIRQTDYIYYPYRW